MFDTTLLDHSRVNDVREWLTRASKGDILLLRTQTSGCGLTSMLTVLLAETQCEQVALKNTSTRIKTLIEDAGMTLYTALERKKKIIVFDPIDALFAGEPMASSDILSVLEDPPLPVICMGFLQRSSLARILDTLNKKIPYTMIEFPHIRDDVAMTALTTLFPNTEKDIVLTVWKNAHGDFRAAKSALQMGDERNMKDIVCDGLDALKKILFSSGIQLRDCIQYHHGDPQMLTMGVFENYHLTNPAIDVCSIVSDSFSKANIVEERIFGNQEFQLSDFHASLSVGYAAAYLPKTDKPPPIHKVGSLWSRANNQRSKEKTVQAIAFAMLSNGWTPLHAPDIAYVRGLILQYVKTDKYKEIISILGNLDDAIILHIMRLFKTSYSQSQHSKLKKIKSQC